jgi:FMN phosphatase YigB (HAD superfamily)
MALLLLGRPEDRPCQRNLTGGSSTRLNNERKEVPVFPAHQHRWVTFDCYGTLVDRGSPTRPLSDVESLLAELRRRGYKLGVLTNLDDPQFEAVHRGFKQPFDLFVTADRIRAHKPDLWHFRAFQRLAQVRRHDWVHVASDLQHTSFRRKCSGSSVCGWIVRALVRTRRAQPRTSARRPRQCVP